MLPTFINLFMYCQSFKVMETGSDHEKGGGALMPKEQIVAGVFHQKKSIFLRKKKKKKKKKEKKGRGTPSSPSKSATASEVLALALGALHTVWDTLYGYTTRPEPTTQQTTQPENPPLLAMPTTTN